MTQETADVCVVGAGCGGIGAAITAGRLGADVILIERDKWLGGTTTNGGVCVWQPAINCCPLCREVYDRGAEAGIAQICRANAMPDAETAVKRFDRAAVYAYTMLRMAPWTHEFANGYVISFVPRGYDRIVRDMLCETGNCRVLDETAFTEARGNNGRVQAVRVVSDDGECEIRAETFIDCTGDVFVARSVGVETNCGEDPKSLYDEPSAPENGSDRLNGVTLTYIVGPENGLQRPEDCEEYDCDHIHGSADIVQLADRRFAVNNCFMLSGDEAHDMGLEKAHDVLSRRVWLYWDKTRKRYGLDDYTICWIAPRLGLREGPRIVGRYVMTEHDFRAGVAEQEHDDIIAVSSHAMDTHGPEGGCVEPPNGPYGIPFRCLQTREYDNLLVACRGASFSHRAASAVRLQRTIMELGVAAGKAAAGHDPVPAPSHWDF